MVLFTKDNMDSYKPVTLVNIPPVRFIVVSTRKVITDSIQVSWDPEISVAVINTVVVPVEEALADIGMKSRNVVINMECDDEASSVK